VARGHHGVALGVFRSGISEKLPHKIFPKNKYPARNSLRNFSAHAYTRTLLEYLERNYAADWLDVTGYVVLVLFFLAILL